MVDKDTTKIRNKLLRSIQLVLNNLNTLSKTSFERITAFHNPN